VKPSRPLALALVLVLAGCANPSPMPPQRHYRATLVRPDGVVHREIEFSATGGAFLNDAQSGVMTLYKRDQGTLAGESRAVMVAPVGWLIDFQPLAEKRDDH
jgi:hypothetical protein